MLYKPVLPNEIPRLTVELASRKITCMERVKKKEKKISKEGSVSLLSESYSATGKHRVVQQVW